jgi:hypothetical protein
MTTSTTSTSSKVVLATAVLVSFVSLAAAPHDPGSITGSGDLDFNNNFDIPRYDSSQEIAVYFIAPFLFITLLYKIIFHLLFNRVVDADSGANYSFQTSLMSVAATGIMVPSPAWDYVLLAINSIAVLAIGGIIAVLLIVFAWAFQAGRENPVP